MLSLPKHRTMTGFDSIRSSTGSDRMEGFDASTPPWRATLSANGYRFFSAACAPRLVSLLNTNGFRSVFQQPAGNVPSSSGRKQTFRQLQRSVSRLALLRKRLQPFLAFGMLAARGKRFALAFDLRLERCVERVGQELLRGAVGV